MAAVAALGAVLALGAGCAGHASLLDTRPAPGVAQVLPATPPSAAAPAPVPALPSPAQVKPRHSSTLIDVVDGSDFDPQLNQHVSIGGVATQAVFAPDWPPGQPGVGGLAYALYEFVPDLVNDAPLLHLAWAAAPPAGAVWVGLADFSANRWEWQRWQAGQDIPVDLAGKNVNNQGSVRAVVLLTGSAGCTLGRLRIGANKTPQVQAVLTHPNQPAPFTLQVSAAGSDDPDGVIVSYDFDFDGDGVYEVTGSPGSQAAFNVPADGSFRCKVRVTDDDGDQTVEGFPWDTGYHENWSPFNTYGAATFYGVCAIPAGGCYAAGASITQSGGDWHALLVKFNADSTVAWARSFSSPNSDFAQCVALAPDGGAYIVGSYNSQPGSNDAFIARYAPDGSLTWQRSWGGGKNGQDYALAADNVNNRLYLATTLGQDVTGGDAALLQLSSDGQWEWTRIWGGVGQDNARGVALAPDGSLYLGCFNEVAGGYGGALVQLSAQGDQLAKLRYTEAGDYVQPAGLSVRSDGVVALCGNVEDITTHNSAPYCVTLNSSLVQRWAVQYFNTGAVPTDSFTNCVFAPDGKLWLAGYLKDTHSSTHGGVLAWIADDGLSSQLWIAGPDGQDNGLPGIDINPDGSLLVSGYVWGAGDMGLSDPQRPVANMQLTYTTPAPNAYLDTTAPLVSTGVSAAIQSLASPDTGAILYKFYRPLP